MGIEAGRMGGWEGQWRRRDKKKKKKKTGNALRTWPRSGGIKRKGKHLSSRYVGHVGPWVGSDMKGMG